MATATAKIAITGEDRTKKAFNSVQNSLGNLNKSFGSLKAGLGAVMGVAGVGAFISQMTLVLPPKSGPPASMGN
jgi:hypothetical protein